MLQSVMARRKEVKMTRGERRRLRARQVMVAILAILVITSFVISLIAR